MILILSTIPTTIKALATNQANGSVATFGACAPIGFGTPTLGGNENLFLVAPEVSGPFGTATTIQDDALSWTVQTLTPHLQNMFPQPFKGDVYFAAAKVDQLGACWHFAGMLNTMLKAECNLSGSVYYHPHDTHGPIPAPGSPRWTLVRPLTVVPSANVLDPMLGFINHAAA